MLNNKILYFYSCRFLEQYSTVHTQKKKMKEAHPRIFPPETSRYPIYLRITDDK